MSEPVGRPLKYKTAEELRYKSIKSETVNNGY